MGTKVAIVGLAYRFPSPDGGQFDDHLREGKDLISSVHPTRWNQAAYQHPDNKNPGTAQTFTAGTLGDIGGFDAGFFRISPREASEMDPQQRLLLELSWEAFEDAGIMPSKLSDESCGVYIGISSSDYSYHLLADMASIGSTVGTGNTASISANRLSYFYNLTGPSMAIDTACSSSLVAFHQACQAIRSGEIDYALTGGVSLHLHPYGFVIFSKAAMLSPLGRCKVFDESGDGYVRSEGAGIFLLKNYDRAILDGDRILATVEHTQVNTDGKKSGLTVPKTGAQASLLERTYKAAGIAAEEISYIEAHGTGTAVGDPIETMALGQALGVKRSKNNPLPIGSVKSNVGHMEAASGVAGLVKALHIIKHRSIPATIGIKKLNPRIDFDDLNLRVVTEAEPIVDNVPVVVGINSFGFGGANAHAILRSPPVTEKKKATESTRPLPIVLSAATQGALRDVARNLSEDIVHGDTSDIYDIAYHLAFAREWLNERAVFFAENKEDLQSKLTNIIDSVTDDENQKSSNKNIFSQPVLHQSNGPVFFFSGNGSQFSGMGKRLLKRKVFSDAIAEIDQTFVALGGYSIRSQIESSVVKDQYDHTDVAQPTLFAIQVGITRLLASLGVVPKAVAGHSVGEIAAAWASGSIDLQSAVRLVYHRSRLQEKTKTAGGMTAVTMRSDNLLSLLQDAGLNKRVSIASINSHRSVTIAGDKQALEVFEKVLAKQRIAFKRLDLDYAFHSPAMDVIKSDLLEVLAGLQPKSSDIPFYSTVTGSRQAGETLTNDYWWKNIRLAVQFESVTDTILNDKFNILVEIGPHPILGHYLKDALTRHNQTGLVVATLSKTQSGIDNLHALVCQVLAAQSGPEDSSVNLTTYFTKRGFYAQLSHYPWQRERYWISNSDESVNRLLQNEDHPLLGYRMLQQDWVWEQQLDLQKPAFLNDHVVGKEHLFPGSGFIEIALAAAGLWQPKQLLQVTNLNILTPITFHSEQSKVLRVSLNDTDGTLTIKSRNRLRKEPWVTNAICEILPTQATSGTALSDKLILPVSVDQAIKKPDFDGTSHLKRTLEAGLNYGDAFQAISHGWSKEKEAIALFQIPSSIRSDLDKYHLHPALLDCSLQLILQAIGSDITLLESGTFVPVHIGKVSFNLGNGAPHYAKVVLAKVRTNSLVANFTLYSSSYEAIALVEQVRLKAISFDHPTRDRFTSLYEELIPMPLQPERSNSLVKLSSCQDSTNTAARRILINRTYRAYVDELDPLLDILCVKFFVEALKHTDTDSSPEKTINKWIELSPALAPWLKYLLQIAEEDGLLVRSQEGLGFANSESNEMSISALDLWKTLISDYPDFSGIVHCVGLVGLNLLDIASGRVTIESILNDNFISASFAGEMVGKYARLEILQSVIKPINEATARLSASERLSILEIAAESPVIALDLAQLLEHNIPNQGVITFASFNAAKAQDSIDWKESNNILQLDTINLNDRATIDSAWRADSNHRSDLAIVWLHHDTLEEKNQAIYYAMQHLKTDGVLIAIGQHPTRWFNFVYGLKPSWWFESKSGKNNSCQRTRDMWSSHLSSLGFDNLSHLETSRDSNAGPFLLLGTLPTPSLAEATLSENRDLSPLRNWLLLTNSSNSLQSSVANAICEGLQQRTGMVSICNSDDPSIIESEIIKVASLYGELDGIINLLDFGSNPNEDLARKCSIALNTISAYKKANSNAPIIFITHHAYGDPSDDVILAGFVRTLSNEFYNQDIRLIDIDSDKLDQDLFTSLINELTIPTNETEVSLQSHGVRLVPRITIDTSNADKLHTFKANRTTDNIDLKFSKPGQLRNLLWYATPRLSPKNDEVEVEVTASGLNFRDVMYTLGLLSEEALENGFAGSALGIEFSGKISRIGASVEGLNIGDEVLGFGSGSFSKYVVTKASAVAPIPQNISSEAAATIPSAFFTSYYALIHLAKLSKSERVLIHGGAGGVGLASIQIAQWVGAEVYATAGSNEKRNFLKMLGVTHVLDSRTLRFADDIMRITNGAGVDVVLNSLSGKAISQSLQILKPFGRFLELGKRDFYENTKLGLKPFRNNITYYGVDADQLINQKPQLSQDLLAQIIALFQDGTLHPLPFTYFEPRNIVKAFRYMQQSKHIGKILVGHQKEITVPVQSLRLRRHEIALSLRADAVYLVTGGTQGLGLATAQWLVNKGARHVLLMSRRGLVLDETNYVIEKMRGEGAAVHILACDVSDEQQLSKSLKPWLTRLKGIFHAAAVIEDGLVTNLTIDKLRRVLAPKVAGSQNLHKITLDLDLDYFVMYSSATSLFGNPGQAAYIAANRWMEALAQYRRRIGLPATCMLWGAIKDTGFLARNTSIKDGLQRRMGGQALESTLVLDQLEEALLTGQSNKAILNFHWQSVSDFLTKSSSPRFNKIRTKANAITPRLKSVSVSQMMLELNENELEQNFVEILKYELSRVLELSPEKLVTSKSIVDMGLDSLMAVEFVVAIEARFGIRLSTMTISNNASILTLASHLKTCLRKKSNDNFDDLKSKSTINQSDFTSILERQHGFESSNRAADKSFVTSNSAEVPSKG